MIKSLFLSVLSGSINCTLIITLVMLCSPYIERKYKPRCKYFIWLIVALWLIVPMGSLYKSSPVIPIHYSSEISSDQGSTISNTTENLSSKATDTVTTNNKQVTTQSALKKTDWINVLSYIWSAGMIFCLGKYVLGYMFFTKKLKKLRKPVKDSSILNTVKFISYELNIKNQISLFYIKGLSSPMATGFLHPVILIPENIYNNEDIPLILRHELVHYKRKDIFYKLIMVLASSVHWFNPVIHMMTKDADKNLELCCDEDVIRNEDKVFKDHYSSILLNTIKSSNRTTSVFSTQFNGGVNTMKKRFSFIYNTRKRSKGLLALLIISMLVVLSPNLIGCQSSSGSSAVKPETICNDFIKTYYTVDDYTNVEELMNLRSTDSDSAKQASNEKVEKLTREALMNYVTEDELINLVANRTFPLYVQLRAYSDKYKIEVKDIKLTQSSKKDDLLTYAH